MVGYRRTAGGGHGLTFEETEISGVYVVGLEPREDERGFFARAFCADEFAEHGMVPQVAQANLSGNVRAGTTRGLHYRPPEHAEAKLFRCIRGETFHVAVDMRGGSPTFGKWTGHRLSAKNRKAFYVPPVCAAGYRALVDGAEVLYLASAPYVDGVERGVRPDDPALDIDWPLQTTVMSDRDRSWPPIDVP